MLLQLQLEGDPETLAQVRAFNRSIGLPCCLRDLGVPANQIDAAATSIVAGTMTAPYITNFPRPVTAASLTAAIHHVESLN